MTGRVESPPDLSGAPGGQDLPGTDERALVHPRVDRWQAAFPYHWDADDDVSRHELLRVAVLASGALFAGTGLLAALGLVQRQGTTAPRLIARTTDVPRGGARYVAYPSAEDQAVLLHLPDGQFVAYSQRCTHLSCAVYYDRPRSLLVCPCHEGVFDPRTGDPVAGPPQRPLPRIVLRRRGTALYAVAQTPAEAPR